TIIINFNNPILESFFNRCESLTLDNTKRLIQDFLHSINEDQQEEFSKIIFDRVHAIKDSVQSYIVKK
ncbi:MAG: hypothetical protein AAGG81_03125, partial [Chlamydiota bacterium]